MKFEWNELKAASNVHKHGISFDLAITVFDDPSALIATDETHSNETEAREWIIGLSDKGILVVIFTKRLAGKIYRLISARKANRSERKLYEEFKNLSL